jgi:hypothetical protein
VANSTESEVNPVVASNRDHQLLCAYEKRLNSGVTVIAARFITTADSALIALEKTQVTSRALVMRAFPNPFSSNVYFQVRSPSVHLDHSASAAFVEIYDLQGKRVALLSAENRSVGTLEYVWKTKNNANGLYIAKIKMNGMDLKRKVLLIQ